MREKRYFFIDEGGDPSFYAKRKTLLVGKTGFQPMLNLGMVALSEKKTIRSSILNFGTSLKDDSLYGSIHSLSQSDWYFHACKDHPEVRAKFFEFLRSLPGFDSYIVLGRKRLDTFTNKHNSNEKEFYFDLVYHLLKDRMNREDIDYHIYLSAREKSTQKHLGEAIQKALARDQGSTGKSLKINYKFNIVKSQDTPELSIIDYLLWGLQRYIIKGESRFYSALQSKYTEVIDLYDQDNENGHIYNQNRPFSLDIASEFKWNGYV